MKPLQEREERFDTDLSDRVDTIVTDVAHDMIDDAIRRDVIFDSGGTPNRIATEWAEEADMDDVFRVIEEGPLPREELTETYLLVTDSEGEPYNTVEQSVRYMAANNLQNMVRDRLEHVTRRH